MHFTSITGLVSFAALTAASTISSPSDLDGSVWANLSPANDRRAFTPQIRNRPAKRQSGWNPPSELTTPLKEVWDHCLKTYSDGNLFGFKNYGWDQIMATKGNINVCVRWDSTKSVTEAERAKVATAVSAQYEKWFKWVYGFDNFPYSKVNVKVVGWAVKDKSLLQGSTSGIDVYTNTDADGKPECAPACGRAFHQDGNYGSCPGGADRHYDQSLWLTDGLQGGFGGDWGQQVGREYFMGLLDAENIHILLHEMGHTFGLDDFYDWTPTGVTNFIMLAGSAAVVTDFDGWMFRNWWYELSRNRGWQSSSGSGSGSSNTSPSKPTTTAKANTPTKTSTPVKTSVVVPPVQTATPGKTTAVTPSPAQTSASSGNGNTGGSGTVQKWYQCGGNGYTGPTQCASGLTCTKHNDYYSQCL